jgi:RNase P subunit RPR2
MLNIHKKKELELLVIGGFCPNCRSVHLKYSESIRNTKFEFSCSKCHWKAKYGIEDLKEASTHWFQPKNIQER